tara:strand:+ start:2268 stop:3749 length:1482 start_codon:yes stop_codon:yes gene_type:complete
MAAPVIQLKRGLLANLPGLKGGEPGFTTDSYDLYVGLDETTANNKLIGSGRYWSVNSATKGSGVNLVEGTNNGTSFVTIKSPDSLSGIVTYTMPGTDGSNGNVLITDGAGNLSFSTPAASSFTIAAENGTSDTFNTGETLTFAAGEGIDTTVSNNQILIAAELATETNPGVATFDGTDFTVTSGDVTLNAERIQDITGAQLVTNGSHTRITAAYDDAGDGAIDLTVDNDLSNYDNSTSAFITAASSDTLTNKTFDANGTGNALSNVEVADFAAAAIVLESEGIGSNDNDTSIPTSAAVKDYVDNNVTAQDLDISDGTHTGSVDLDSQSLTFSGTTNEIETVVANQSVTIGLPNNVTVSNNLTVSGNLYVNGSTTQVNTTTLNVEDALVDFGLVNDAGNLVPPSSDLNKDIGVLFNYYTTAPKKAAVFWDDSTSRVVVSADVSENTGVLTNNTGGALEVASLYVSGCTGSTVEVIGCSGGEVVITNATIDGGSF